jgi:hypothetical protein
MFKTLKYSQSFKLTAGASGVFGAEQEMRLNSLFDPDQTGGGHQPYGRDTFAGIYNRYKVYGAYVIVTVTNINQDGMAFGTLVTTPTNTSDTLAGATPENIREKNMCSVHYGNLQGGKVYRWKQYLRLCDVMGITPEQFRTDLDNTTAPMGGNPGDSCAIHFAVSDLQGPVSPTLNAQVLVDIYYKVMLYDRIELAQS